MNKKRIFSGVQPSGNLTLGNYLGAIKNWVSMQDENDCIFCMVDSHTITVPQDPIELRQNTLACAAAYIASGIDPKKSMIYPQSWVPQHVELSWIFSCITPIGWLNRMTQFKDKAGKNKEKAGLGLYAYPVLMAADILLFHADKVPVGDDQTQHLELTRDIAAGFNHKYNTDYFTLPETIVNKKALRIMSLRDGKKKMSKSNPSEMSRINITDSNDLIIQKIKKAKTDAVEGISFDQENRPEISNLLNIYAALEDTTIDQAVIKFQNYGTADFKKTLAEIIIAHIAPVRDRINDLLKHEDHLLSIMTNSVKNISPIADKTIKEVKNIIGFLS